MFNIDFSKLNDLEKKIHDTLLSYSKDNFDIKINEAAEICGCSISKISKFVKKLGFNNYKQYMNFLYNKDLQSNGIETLNNELIRINNFINSFDMSLVDEFIHLIDSYQKIILFGYGPSYICTQYFEYKLRINTNKIVVAVPDEVTLTNIIDEQSLVVIFSVTCKFKSFENVYNACKEKNCKVLLVTEEYDISSAPSFVKIFWLCKFPQPADLQPYEKSRIVFFIFIEQVILHLIYKNKDKFKAAP